MEDKLSANQNNYSKVSQELFWQIIQRIDNSKNKIYFAELNKEFNVYNGNGIYFFDFVDTSRKKVIEFNGDYFHANPSMYAEGFYNEVMKKTSKEIWNADKNKLDFIKLLGYNVYVVWNKDYQNDPKSILQNCIDFLNQ